MIKDFIAEIGIPANEPVFIGGDLNVNMYDTGEYEQMKTLLNATHPARKEHSYTADPSRNDLNSGNTREYLDYILYSNEHLRPRNSLTQVLPIKADKKWKEFSWEGGNWDLSDHFPVYGRFEF
jgi:endonuclease/exonuclease/phosphatase family metal-dependent hydrolase